MIPQPTWQPEREERKLPDYLPARMVNEFTYCQRLFYLEWVEGQFQESGDTVEGKFQHQRVDTKTPTELPSPTEITEERLHSRSVMLASETLRVIAKMDLIEVRNGEVTPVDYKHGRPMDGEAGLELWPADRAQLGLQILILRENGYRCDEAVAYYAKTKQRVRVTMDNALEVELKETVGHAWELAAGTEIPPPLEDSPKCPGCSMVGICLPDETNALIQIGEQTVKQIELFGKVQSRKPVVKEIRQLVTPRDERKPVYLNTQGLRVGKSGEVLQAKDKDTVVQEIRIGEACQVNLMGNVQVTTQAIQRLCEADVPICYFSQGGWFYGITTGLNTKNIFLRRTQFRMADGEWFCVSLAAKLVAGKIRNQRTMLQRNHVEPSKDVIGALKRHSEKCEEAKSLESLLGIEGNAARLYFGEFNGLLKGDDATTESEFQLDFERRNRRPPRDPVNAMLSLGYSMLAKDLTIACYAVGFDPYLGFYHQPRFGRPALALDLMEPFRPLIVDSAVLNAVNMRMVTARDFVRAGGAVALTQTGRKAFIRAYEMRMDSLVTHPLFDYRVTYRRLLEIQVRLLARYLQGEIGDYPVFVTR